MADKAEMQILIVATILSPISISSIKPTSSLKQPYTPRKRRIRKRDKKQYKPLLAELAVKTSSTGLTTMYPI